MIKPMTYCISILLFTLVLQGCAPTSYNIKAPTPSAYSYKNLSAPLSITLNFQDNRAEKDKNFSYGILKANLLIDKKVIDPIAYIKEHTVKELGARGINAKISDSSNVNVSIKKLMIRNHRTNGYSPFVTFSMLSGSIKTDKGEQTLGIFIKRGKVPVWSFEEVVEPTFNEPLSLLIKELSAKINQVSANQSITDEHVNQIVASIDVKQPQPNTYLNVYELGFGNNKSAVKHLLELTKHSDEYIRLAAISSLGILKADSELKVLESIYYTAKIWQDRGMALKAICDMGTPSAIDLAKKIQAELDSSKEKNSDDIAWSKEVLSLYF